MDAKKIIVTLLCSVIIAVGFITGAAIFSGALAERPLMGSFSGSLTSSNYTYPELMETDALMAYLAIYPGPEEADYDAAYSSLKHELESNILNGKWPGFPHVNLGGRLYFSRQAVDEWFLEKSKGQLEIK